MGRKRQQPKPQPKPYNEEEIIWTATFANNMKYLMYIHKTSSPKIARDLGLSYGEMRKYAYGNERPTDEMVRKIAGSIGCTVDELIDPEGVPTPFGRTKEEIAEIMRSKKEN